MSSHRKPLEGNTEPRGLRSYSGLICFACVKLCIINVITDLIFLIYCFKYIKALLSVFNTVCRTVYDWNIAAGA